PTVPEPPASVSTAGELLPSPQSKVAVCVSNKPASVKLPPNDSVCPRTPGLGAGPAREATAGATLLTVIEKVPVALRAGVPLSMTGTVTVAVAGRSGGVHVKTPVCESTLAPAGAASRLKVNV